VGAARDFSAACCYRQRYRVGHALDILIVNAAFTEAAQNHLQGPPAPPAARCGEGLMINLDRARLTPCSRTRTLPRFACALALHTLVENVDGDRGSVVGTDSIGRSFWSRASQCSDGRKLDRAPLRSIPLPPQPSPDRARRHQGTPSALTCSSAMSDRTQSFPPEVNRNIDQVDFQEFLWIFGTADPI
jgi:hypothetical protein